MSERRRMSTAAPTLPTFSGAAAADERKAHPPHLPLRLGLDPPQKAPVARRVQQAENATAHPAMRADTDQRTGWIPAAFGATRARGSRGPSLRGGSFNDLGRRPTPLPRTPALISVKLQRRFAADRATTRQPVCVRGIRLGSSPMRFLNLPCQKGVLATTC